MAQRKILCLHGMGSSGQILKAQLAPLLSTLSRFDFLFPSGPISNTPPGPGLPADAAPFYSWFTWPSAQKAPNEKDVASVREALEELDALAEMEGPFDGVFGFSQGATLAAGWLMRRERRMGTEMPARFVVLFNAYGIGIAEVEEAVEARGEEDSGSSDEESRSRAVKLRTPSLHVCGRRDSFLPGSMALLDACESSMASVVMHEGGHAIPRDPRTVDEIARAIETLMHRAIII